MEEPLNNQKTDRREVNGVAVEITKVGEGRIRRVTYPSGFRWSKDMKGSVGTSHCEHTHVGYIVEGSIEIQYSDGCRVSFTAPQPVVIEAGHDGWVTGNRPAVMIEFDFEGETAKRFGLPDAHRH